MTTTLSIPRSKINWISLTTWVVVLLASDLPNAVWQALVGEPPGWLFWVKIGMLLALVFASLAWTPLQPTRTFFLLLLTLMLALWGMNWLRSSPAYLQWESGASWAVGMAGYQGLKLVVVAIMVIELLLLGKKPKEFFLTLGQWKAPVRTLPSQERPGKRQLTWGALGLILGVCIAPLTLLFFGVGNLPASTILARALPYFPAVLLFAAMNAFSEEMQFRASLLGEVQKITGPDQALWLTAAFFGMAHYFGGEPSGAVGVIIAGLLGALFAKCMQGSKGLAVPWFVHFCQNAVIYAFWAFGAVA